MDLGPRAWLEAVGRLAWNRFDENAEAGFFDYDNRTLRAGVGYDIGGDLRATVSYSYERMPPSPDRAIVESTSHSLLGSISGQLAALTSASVSAGFRSEDHPLASGESGSWNGLTLGASLRRELGHSTVAEVVVNRTTEPSAYDTNAFYVNNSILASLTTTGPFEVWLRGGVGFLPNQYPNDAWSCSRRWRGLPSCRPMNGWQAG